MNKFLPMFLYDINFRMLCSFWCVHYIYVKSLYTSIIDSHIKNSKN